MRAFARCRSSPPQCSPVGRGFGASGNRTHALSVVLMATVGTLDGVAGCRVVRDDTDVEAIAMGGAEPNHRAIVH